MEKVKYEKYKDTDGVYTYEMTLPDGQTFKEVPMELGNYVHHLEQTLIEVAKGLTKIEEVCQRANS